MTCHLCPEPAVVVDLGGVSLCGQHARERLCSVAADARARRALRPTPSDAAAALRCAEAQLCEAWKLRAQDEQAGARAVRRASRAHARAELMVLASQGDREALRLLAGQGAAA